MLEKIVEQMVLLRKVEESPTLRFAATRALGMVKAYIGREVPTELEAVCVEIALGVFDRLVTRENSLGGEVSQIREGNVTIGFEKNDMTGVFDEEWLSEYGQELNRYRCLKW